MPQKRPDFHPGGVYHVFNRGSHRVSIFHEPENYIFVLRKIKQHQQELNLTLLAYCLMPNHYHFLIRQDGDQPARLLSQRVFNSYSKAYNKRYQHSGTLFEGPYRVRPVLESAHLLHLCRYIHANPVKDGLVKQPGNWPYSNYLEWVGQRDGSLVDRTFVQAHFAQPGQYVEFVEDYLRTRMMPIEMAKYLQQLED
ncbi:MAG: transposase [Anaerolineales bacterium]|nr:transposase [Anaerolineales bacterium]